MEQSHEYRFAVSQDHIRSLKSPHNDDLSIIHAFVKIKDFKNGVIPDKVNPRAHEVKATGRIAEAISKSLESNPEIFHLLNRGCLIVADKAWYDNQSKLLHFTIANQEDYGMVDGATTDRTLAALKNEVSPADFAVLKDSEIPDKFKDSYLHLEIISGELSQDLRIQLAGARNTSNQVKDFSLEDLGGGFDWLKEVIEKSELRGRIRYRENDPQPVDVRTVLALLYMFHPSWFQASKDLKGSQDPVKAYSGKGAVLDEYKTAECKAGFEKLAPVVVDILKLYDYIHVNFPAQYRKIDEKGRLGRLVEVKFISDEKKARVLPLTELRTQYVLPDGWLYPLLGSFRMLLDWPKGGRGKVQWITDPFKFFGEYGHELVRDVIDQSEELGRNPNTCGKSKRLWSGLRMLVKDKLNESRTISI